MPSAGNQEAVQFLDDDSTRFISRIIEYFEGTRGDEPGASERLDAALRWLWDAMVGPILDLVGAESEVVVIATGTLGVFPLHAAWHHDQAKPQERRYALDTMAFRTAPNTRMLMAARQSAAAWTETGPALLAIADPRPSGFDPLPGAYVEAALVQRHFSPAQSTLLRREAATRERVMQGISGKYVVHCACHTVTNQFAPLESGLVLAQDSLLTLRTILKTGRFDARLVVLSSCDSAAMEFEVANEYLSLSAGCLALGAGGVIGALWPVPDAITVLLMSRFYDLWLGSAVPPCEALTLAQQWVRDAPFAEKRDFLRAAGSPEASVDIEGLIKALDGVDTTRPRVWAAFSYAGA